MTHRDIRPAQGGTGRSADLYLRGSAGPLPVRVHWPPSRDGSAMPALLLFAAGPDDVDAVAARVCGDRAVVVLALHVPRAAADARLLAVWCAVHGAELEADPLRLLVAGRGAGAGVAAGVVAWARARGWPPLALVTVPGETY